MQSHFPRLLSLSGLLFIGIEEVVVSDLDLQGEAWEMLSISARLLQCRSAPGEGRNDLHRNTKHLSTSAQESAQCAVCPAHLNSS